MRPLPWEQSRPFPTFEAQANGDLWTQAVIGFYPEIASSTQQGEQRSARLWQAGYVQTYLERDVRNLRNIGDLTLFQIFLRSLATRSASLLNLSDLARDVGIAINTAKNWLSILEASFQVFLLRPYFVNLGKRLVKSPKVYFTDTGLLCYLVGLQEPGHAAAGPMGGALLENLVVAELYKTYLHRGQEPAMYFWRTAAGAEVDVIIETPGGLVPVEIKASATARPAMAAQLQAFRRDFGDRAAAGFVIHPGKMLLPLGEGALAWPLTAL
jgi:hypothetical protein